MAARVKKISLAKQAAAPRASRFAKSRESRLQAFLRRHGISLLAAGVLLLLVHDVFGDRGFLAMRRSQKEIEQLEQEITRLNEENQRITGEIETLKTDPTAIERIARDEMGLARPGELVFTLPPKPDKKD